MIRTRDIMASLPMVASVLGDRYGVQVHIGGKQAYTNGKMIHLPSLPLHCNATLLAQARGFLDHEAAHIRHTDFDTLQAAKLTPLQKHLWNSIEDWRVENKLAALFPGCRQHFHWLIKHYFGEEEEITPALTVLNYVVLSVRSWDVPEIVSRKDAEGQTVDAAYPGLRAKLDAILVRVQQECRSTQDAIDYALEMHAVIKAYAQKAESSERRQATSNAEKSGTDSQENPPETTDAAQSDCTSQSEEDSSADSPTQTQQARPAEQLQDMLTAPTEALPKHLGEQLAETIEKYQARDCNSIEVAQLGIKHSKALSESVKTQVLQSTTALRTRLHGLLQAKAQQHCIPGRRGKLNPQRLHAIMLNNPKVFLKRGERKQVATAVHLLLDCSGSMTGANITLATQACYAVAVALERCQGVNVGVTLFPATSISDDYEHSVAALVRHGERVHDRFAVSCGGGTPLAQALWWVMQRMYPLKESRKIICILSDGQPDSPFAVRSTLYEAYCLGFEIIGLGILDANMSLLLPKASRTIYALSDLAPAMFEMLQGALLTQAYA